MGKRLFLLFVSGLIGIVFNPIILTASDSVDLTDLNNEGVVETVPFEEEPEEEIPVTSDDAGSAGAEATAIAATTAATATVASVSYSAPVNYTVSYYVGSEAEYVNTAYNLSYSGLYKYAKLIYGHNTASLLGNLSGRYVGETITITEGGVAYNYRVASKALYAKTADGNLNGDVTLMSNIAYTAFGHDYALMTCAGTSYGNGDASHRLVVYVDRI